MNWVSVSTLFPVHPIELKSAFDYFNFNLNWLQLDSLDDGSKNTTKTKFVRNIFFTKNRLLVFYVTQSYSDTERSITLHYIRIRYELVELHLLTN